MRLLRFHLHSTEQNVADDLAVKFGDKRKQDDAFLPQPIDQVRFVAASERGHVEFADLLPVPRLFLPDKQVRL